MQVMEQALVSKGVLYFGQRAVYSSYIVIVIPGVHDSQRRQTVRLPTGLELCVDVCNIHALPNGQL